MLKNMKWVVVFSLFVSVAFAEDETYGDEEGIVETESVAESVSVAEPAPVAELAPVEQPAPPVIEQEKRRLYMEINKLEQREGICVAYVRFTNRTDTEFSEFKSELFAFNKDEVITAHFLADFQQVMADKTVVKLVPMKNTVCSDVGSILLNRMTACMSGGEEVPNCLRMLETGAKGTIKLFK